MIKILFCVNKLSIGGVERRLSQLMVGLYKLRTYSLHCIVNNNERLLDPELGNYVNIITINPQTQKEVIVEQYKKVICDIKPDIVHCWTMSQCEIINALEQQFRSNFIYICGAVNSAYKYAINSHRYLLMKDCLKKADIILSNSDAGIKAKHIPLEKSLVIKNGYNFERLDFIDNSHLDENIKTQMSNYENIILMACRICMEKDIQMGSVAKPCV